MEDEVLLRSVNVGLPQIIGRHRGHDIASGIVKEPVAVATLQLSPTNLEGDRQADLSCHGGPDKAVYAYASEHLAAWSAELGRTVGYGFFGENLSTEGALETGVAIGDIWSWGDAILQVAQPRTPCFKLTIRSGVSDIASRFRRRGRSGWYLRVLQPGEVPVAGPVTVVERDPAAVTVHDAHLAALPHAPDDAVRRVLAVPALADEWRSHLD